jgi:hypothetical protein
MSPPDSKSGDSVPERPIRCPGCGGPSLYSPRNPYRPFCSERCKKIDLGAWASESFRLAAEEPPEPQEGQDGAPRRLQ